MASEKGQRNEREECRFISLWWTHGEADDVFWRNRVKITSKTPNAEKQLGDMACMKSIGLAFIETFNVELKIGYSKKRKDHKVRWDLLDILDSKQLDDHLQIFQFWRQCEDDALLSNRIPLLIFSRERHEPVVCFNPKTFFDFVDMLGVPPFRRLLFQGGEYDPTLCFYRKTDFFEWLTPEAVDLVHSRKHRRKRK